MTRISDRPSGATRMGERVTRPNGSVWKLDPRSGRAAHTEQTPDGPVILALRTHDLELAARIAEVRWRAAYPDLPMPEGVREWRRHEARQWPSYSAVVGTGMRVGPSTGHETRSFPVVAYRAPTATEGGKQ